MLTGCTILKPICNKLERLFSGVSVGSADSNILFHTLQSSLTVNCDISKYERCKRTVDTMAKVSWSHSLGLHSPHEHEGLQQTTWRLLDSIWLVFYLYSSHLLVASVCVYYKASWFLWYHKELCLIYIYTSFMLANPFSHFLWVIQDSLDCHSRDFWLKDDAILVRFETRLGKTLHIPKPYLKFPIFLGRFNPRVASMLRDRISRQPEHGACAIQSFPFAE